MLKSRELIEPNSCLNRAKMDETIFVLLARDPAAPVAILAWLNERIRLGCETPDSPKIKDAYEQIQQMMKEREALSACQKS